VPTSIVKSVHDLTERVRTLAAEKVPVEPGKPIPLSALPLDEMARMIKQLEKEMKAAAEALEFEKAAVLRDQILELRQAMEARDTRPIWEKLRERKTSGIDRMAL